MKRDATSDVPDPLPQAPRESGIFPRSAPSALRTPVAWHSRRETVVSMRASIRPPPGPAREVAALVHIARPPRLPKDLGPFVSAGVPSAERPMGWTRKTAYALFFASMATLAAAAAALLNLRR